MKCPVCVSVDLSVSSREGVEIDFCPKCRGVWLDRNELDKIIDRSTSRVDDRDEDDDRSRGRAAYYPGPNAAPPAQHHPQGHSHGHPPPGWHKDNDDSKYGYTYKQPRKKSWLKDLLDF